MDVATRFLSLFTDGRHSLDRVPTFVQGVLGAFVNHHEAALFDEHDGPMVYNAAFDAPLVLGFDAVFASMPGTVSVKPVHVTGDDGLEHTLTLSAQVHRQGSSYYAGGLLTRLDVLEVLKENVHHVDSTGSIRETMSFYEKISPLIFPVPMVGGVFDTAWQSMGFSSFAREHRKNTRLYKEVIAFYADVTRTNIERIIDAVGSRPRIINILDDVAYKGRPIIAPERWAQDLGKYYKEITGMVRDAGMNVIIHSDGDVTALLPHLIDAGFEGLQGWEGGANPETIASEYPDFVTIGWGDVGDVLPFGSRDAIEHHVKDLLVALKVNRRVALGPSTVIHDKIPLENARYFVECIKKHGRY